MGYACQRFIFNSVDNPLRTIETFAKQFQLSQEERDESHALSDIDILVEFRDKATFDQYMKLKFFLEDTLDCPIDLVTRKALKPRIRDSVERIERPFMSRDVNLFLEDRSSPILIIAQNKKDLPESDRP
jgi:predicted nucleotidyltransferase